MYILWCTVTPAGYRRPLSFLSMLDTPVYFDSWFGLAYLAFRNKNLGIWIQKQDLISWTCESEAEHSWLSTALLKLFLLQVISEPVRSQFYAEWTIHYCLHSNMAFQDQRSACLSLEDSLLHVTAFATTDFKNKRKPIWCQVHFKAT